MNQSTLPATTGDHCLSAEQVLALRKAVDELDAFVVQCVEERRQNHWVRPGLKDIADFRVRALLVCTTNNISIASEADPWMTACSGTCVPSATD